MATSQILERDNSKKFEYHPGDIFNLLLDENPGTSFEWTRQPILPEAIELLSTRFEPLLPETPGSGGVRVYQFRAKKPGVAKIHLALKRSYYAKIRKTFEVTIKVTG